METPNRSLGYDIFDLLPTAPAVGDYFKQSENPAFQNGYSDSISPNYIRDGAVYGILQSSNFQSGVDGWIIRPDGSVEFNNGIFRGTIQIGGQYITVAPGDSIQTAIDTVHAGGGGVVILQNGTHTPGSDIVLYSDTTLQGQNGETAIIDFAGGAYSIKAIGTSAYTTGTISVSNNATTVTGVGTSWVANVTPGQSILLAGVWYPVAAVTDNTHLSIGIPFADVALSGAAYTTASNLQDIKILSLTVKNSAQSAIKFQYCNEFIFDDLNIQTSLVGIELNTCSQVIANNLDLTANYTNYSFTNTHFLLSLGSSSVDALASHGILLNTVTNTAISGVFVLNSAGDGVNITSCSNCRLDGVFVENGGEGIELVSNNSNIVIFNNRIEKNASDGIKLTASSDNIFIQSSFIKDNTGYGVNVAASTDDNCVITGNSFSGNTTSAANDSGTGTVVRGNVGLADNGTSGSGTITKLYTTGESITANDAVIIANGTQQVTVLDNAVSETTSGSFGQSAGSNERIGVAISVASSFTFEKVKLNLSKNGTPSDNLVVAIQADSAGSPSGVDLATSSIGGGSLTGSQVAYTFTLSAPVSVTAGTYWVVLRRSGSFDVSNYYKYGVAVGSANKNYDGAAWTSSGVSTRVIFIHVPTVGTILKATAATVTYFEGFIGFAGATVAVGLPITITIAGEKTGLSGLTASSQYYLSDTSGLISTSAGSNSRKVGIATSATTLLITNIW